LAGLRRGRVSRLVFSCIVLALLGRCAHSTASTAVPSAKIDGCLADASCTREVPCPDAEVPMKCYGPLQARFWCCWIDPYRRTQSGAQGATVIRVINGDAHDSLRSAQFSARSGRKEIGSECLAAGESREWQAPPRAARSTIRVRVFADAACRGEMLFEGSVESSAGALLWFHDGHFRLDG